MIEPKEISYSEIPLKIVIIISSFSSLDNTGFGGHYYSALTTVKKLSEMHSVDIINIGDFPSPTLEASDVNLKFINLTYGARLGPDRKYLRRELKIKDPDVVIAFDFPSALIVRRLCTEIKCGFVLVKPGGKQPKGYFPENSFQIYFHLKDFNWAHSTYTDKSNLKVREKYIACIPNRVSVPPQDWEGIEKLRSKYLIKNNEIIIIRISRISEAYRQSFVAAIRLSNFLRDCGYPVRLLIIGVCQNESLLREIQENIKEKDIVLTSPEYTKNASRFLKVADINIGVGRGFMEGCALEQYMMAINSATDLPTVVTRDNFSFFFEENFSMRVNFQEHEEKNKERIIEIVEKCLDGKTKNSISKQWFDEHFSDNKLLSLYNKVLFRAQAHPEKLTLDLLKGEWILNARLNLGIKEHLRRRIKILSQSS